MSGKLKWDFKEITRIQSIVEGQIQDHGTSATAKLFPPHPDRTDLKLGNPGNGTRCGIGKDISTAFTEMEGYKHQALLYPFGHHYLTYNLSTARPYLHFIAMAIPYVVGV